MRKPMWIAALSLLTFLAVASTNAAAESFLDLFAGAAFTDSNDIKVSIPGLSVTGEADFDTSFSVGGRVGYWWGFFGLNLDVDYFKPNPDSKDSSVDFDLEVLGVGLNAMLRGQFLKTNAVPEGALQPYIFGGPTVFISRLDVDVAGVGSDDDTDAKLGFTVGGGLAYMFTRNIGAFAEYRFTYSRPKFEVGGVTVKPELNSHHILGGVTLRF
jgi:opacity protein-like surface antigen